MNGDPAVSPIARPATHAPRSRVLAVSSGGGHWDELMLMRPLLQRYDTRYATTSAALAARDGIEDAVILPDCNRNEPVQSLRSVLRAFHTVLRIRPDVIVSTGAAPGFFCILAGRLVGARTIWIDSFANAEQLSMCGKLSRYAASLCLVQWPHLAGARARFMGGLL
jgi:hypothetical protein